MRINLSISDTVIAENDNVPDDNPMVLDLNFPEADYVQLRYESVAVGPHGDDTGVFYGLDGFWHFGDHVFSDITIWQG